MRRTGWLLAILATLALLPSCGVIGGRRSALRSTAPASTTPSGAAPAPAAAAPAAAPLARSLYVGSFAERDAALALATAHGIGELTLYGLGGALRNEPAALASFIETARARGVDTVAPISGMDRVEDLVRYEREHPSGRFDGWVTEFEYWNHAAAERAAQFEVLQRMLTAMRAGKADGWVACYLGYPTAEEARWIAEHVDRVYLSLGIDDPARAQDWGQGDRSHRTRQSYFAGRVPIWPIVYARGDAHMRPWLQQHSMAELEASLRRAMNGQLAGVALFDYGSMHDVIAR